MSRHLRSHARPHLGHGAAVLEPRGLRNPTRHSFARGEVEAAVGTRSSPAARLLLLFGSALSLWWGLYVLARVLIG